MTDPNPTRDSSNGTAWQLFLLTAASSFGPLMVLANANESQRLPTFFMVVVIVTLLGMAARYGFVRAGLDPLASTHAIATFILISMNAVAWAGSSEVNHVLLMAAALTSAVLAYRLSDLKVFRALMTWAALFLVAYPLALLGGKAVGSQPLNVLATGTAPEVGEMMSKPDVVLVFMDAYGGTEVLEELYDFDNSEFQSELRGRGFEVPDRIVANYGRTQLSIPTVLQLDYVADTTVINDSDMKALLGVLGGESRLADLLRENGYRTVHVESGWLGSRCGPAVDVCVGSPWPDETFYDIAYRSVLEAMPGFELGRPFTTGALSASHWLATDMSRYLGDDRPDFVFAHILMPHPPLFVDEQCQPDWRGGAGGFAIGRMGNDEARISGMRKLYVKQLECANRIIMGLVNQLGDDDVALVMGDHGPDSQAQLFMQASDWDESRRQERFETFLAARAPGCDMGDIKSLVNVGRRLVSCLTNSSLPDLPTRLFDIHKTSVENRVIEMDVPSALIGFIER